ncbi:SDR family oxidoreductase [Leisingera sp. M527]|uniref:SDR family NAD(P)-dependent oxidoreductase n=1 Tax=unclassified Leisingera TaxID=2614906 RepID=UPI0021A4EC04|nr:MULTISPECIES: SDR family NAD(P)-dependent oxidoreductase [unclassified Leisingera]UWQ32070.1 SDR family oxidoreductase [Leisingera sp. M527]UWQ79701.1 SDR family oxidoreductase [Leisingera sp. S132]
MAKPLAIVAGAGPGLGQALVSSFGRNGYSAFGLNRTVPQGAGSTLAVDLTDPRRSRSKLRDMICTHGAPKLVVHNTAKLVISPFEDTSNDEFEATWRAMVLSAVNLARSVLPAMAGTGGGTFIVSGATASLRGGRNFAAFASAKAALRALTQSLAREYGPKGVHVVHVILDGIVDTEASRDLHSMDPSRMMQPEDIAETYLALARQPKSTWTHELDLRPMGEAF